MNQSEPQVKKEKYVANDYVEIWMENGCVFGRYTVDIVTLEIAKSCISLRLDNMEDRPWPVYIEMGEIKSMTKDARDLFASEFGYKNIKACSLLVGSSFNRFIGNFFLSISRPKAPTRLFTKKEKALEWLDQFK